MPRYRLLVEYDGGPFVGWQRQDNGPSVQGALEEAFRKFSGESVTICGAGRTDTGVHASGQVAHVDLSRERATDTIRDAVNFHLGNQPVAVLAVAQAEPTFHARFSARERVYLYRICNRRARPALERGRCWWQAKPLDAMAMAVAAQVLVGQHDFTTFRASMCQAPSPVKTLSRLDVRRVGDDILIEARARSFLHHQVRNMVGSLALVGSGKWTRGDLAAALAARDRRRGGPTAPAAGLCLVEVRYADGPEALVDTGEGVGNSD